MLVGAVHTNACFELGGIVYLSGAGVSIIPGTGLVHGRYERLLVRMSNDPLFVVKEKDRGSDPEF